jgi:two-component system response regulator FixJ
MSDLAPIVYIVDDDELSRNYFDAVLAGAGLSCRSVESADAFLQIYTPDQPGCLLLDMQMPGMTGLELQQRLNVLGAVIPVIFASGHADVPVAVQAMRAGAFDFVEKPVARDILLARVRKAFDYDAQNRAVLRQREVMTTRFESLTTREKEVLMLLMTGRSNKAMAGDLHLSQRTVELYRARIMEKTGSRSLAQLIRMAMTVNLSHAAGSIGTQQAPEISRH